MHILSVVLSHVQSERAKLKGPQVLVMAKLQASALCIMEEINLWWVSPRSFQMSWRSIASAYSVV